jgi:hypothetical protein
MKPAFALGCWWAKILDIRLYYFVIHSLFFGMKFCKSSHIPAEEEVQAGRDENHPPNQPLASLSKPPLEPTSQEELYRGDIESFMMGEIAPVVRNYFEMQS